ncbi:MAG: hypothetical protein EA393_14870 [Bacteroidetes bacterium]|nr:MAG: hypothetical protein EA393_14870 [Bacteroidota bacterium]
MEIHTEQSGISFKIRETRDGIEELLLIGILSTESHHQGTNLEIKTTIPEKPGLHGNCLINDLQSFGFISLIG